MRTDTKRMLIRKITGKVLFAVIVFFSASIQASSDTKRFSEESVEQSYSMRYGLDLLFGFLPMPMIEANLRFAKWNMRTTIGSSYVWGRISGGLAYSLTNRQGPELYIDAGGYYAGFVYGHFYEAGIDIKNVSALKSDLRLGVAILNSDSSDPWNGQDVDTTRVFPRIGFVRTF